MPQEILKTIDGVCNRRSTIRAYFGLGIGIGIGVGLGIGHRITTRAYLKYLNVIIRLYTSYRVCMRIRVRVRVRDRVRGSGADL